MSAYFNESFFQKFLDFSRYNTFSYLRCRICGTPVYLSLFTRLVLMPFSAMFSIMA